MRIARRCVWARPRAESRVRRMRAHSACSRRLSPTDSHRVARLRRYDGGALSLRSTSARLARNTLARVRLCHAAGRIRYPFRDDVSLARAVGALSPSRSRFPRASRLSPSRQARHLFSLSLSLARRSIAHHHPFVRPTRAILTTTDISVSRRYSFTTATAERWGPESRKKSRVVVEAGRAAEWERSRPKGIAGEGKSDGGAVGKGPAAD